MGACAWSSRGTCPPRAAAHRWGLSLGSRPVAGTSGPGVLGKLHRERIGQLELGLCGAIGRQKQPRSNPEPPTRSLRARAFGLRQASHPAIPRCATDVHIERLSQWQDVDKRILDTTRAAHAQGRALRDQALFARGTLVMVAANPRALKRRANRTSARSRNAQHTRSKTYRISVSQRRCTAVNDRLDENTWNGVPMCRDAWINAVRTYFGLECRFESSRFGASTVDYVSAGQTIVANINLAWQSISALTHASVRKDEHLYVQIVTSGMMSIEQDGEMMTARPGDMVVVDPLAGFKESFRESTCLVLLNIPKAALRERGLRMRVPSAYLRDSASPDVGVIREILLNVASHAGRASGALLARLGDQCLDLMDVLVNEHNGPAPDGASVVTALRAKQLIARNIGDPGLSVARIAAQLNMSISSLTRALRAQGLSPMRYAWSLRLEHAARLLANAPRSAIGEVAFQCGFANAAHFSRAFKERYEMTPRQYAAGRKAASGDALEWTQVVQRTEAARTTGSLAIAMSAPDQARA